MYSNDELHRIRRQGDQVETVAALLKSRPSSRNAPIWHFQIGLLHIDLRQIEAAIHHLRKAVELDQNNAVAWSNLGIAYLHSAQVAQARAIFEKVLQSEPNDFAANAGMAVLLERLGEPELAAPHAERSGDFFLLQCQRSQELAIASGRRSILKSSMPKSASTFLFHGIKNNLQLAHHRIGVQSSHNHLNFVLIETLIENFRRGGCISHDHIPPSEHNWSVLNRAWNGKIWIHIRDPRDAAVSAFHYLRGTGIGQGKYRDERLRKLRLVRNALAAKGVSTDADLLTYSSRVLLRQYSEFATGWLALARQNPSRLFVTTYELFVTKPDTFFTRVEQTLGLPIRTISLAHVNPDSPTNRYRKGKIGEGKDLISKADAARIQGLQDTLDYIEMNVRATSSKGDFPNAR